MLDLQNFTLLSSWLIQEKKKTILVSHKIICQLSSSLKKVYECGNLIFSSKEI